MLLTAKRLVASAICRPFMGKALSMLFHDRIPHHGCQIDTTSVHVSPSTKATLFWGLYESAETRFVKRYLRSDLDVIELGSSLGVVSSHIARKLEPTCRLVCVEANPVLIESLRRNLQLNRSSLRLSVINAAICYDEQPGQPVTFHVYDDTVFSRLDDNGGRPIQVQTTTLESIVTSHDIGQYSLVCDIEGAEAGFIMGTSNVLRSCQQVIIECHEVNFAGKLVKPEEMATLLQEEHGFNLIDQYGPVYVFERTKI
jgi:FkbM family methyltransferase